jgi:hypothetical protein
LSKAALTGGSVIVSSRRWYVVSSVILLAFCGTEPEPEPQTIRASYGVLYDPNLLVSATENCDRLISHAVLSMNELRDFDLSINVVDDCSRIGGGFSFSEVYKQGDYMLQGTQLSFTPDSATAPLFTGTLDGEFIQLSIPSDLGVAALDVNLRLGPGIAF